MNVGEGYMRYKNECTCWASWWKESMCHSKEQLKTGKSGRDCWELKVIHLLLSRLLEWMKRRWRGSGISWIVCKSYAPRSRQITTPSHSPHHLVLYRPHALPDAQPTASKHWRQTSQTVLKQNQACNVCKVHRANVPRMPMSHAPRRFWSRMTDVNVSVKKRNSLFCSSTSMPRIRFKNLLMLL